jgi:hypothetical protein
MDPSAVERPQCTEVTMQVAVLYLLCVSPSTDGLSLNITKLSYVETAKLQRKA